MQRFHGEILFDQRVKVDGAKPRGGGEGESGEDFSTSLRKAANKLFGDEQVSEIDHYADITPNERTYF